MARLSEVLALSIGKTASCQIALELRVEGIRSVLAELSIASMVHVLTKRIRTLGTWQSFRQEQLLGPILRMPMLRFGTWWSHQVHIIASAFEGLSFRWNWTWSWYLGRQTTTIVLGSI